MYGKGCPGSTASGVSTGKIAVVEHVVQVLAVVVVQLVPAAEPDPGGGQRRDELVEEQLRLAGDQLGDPGAGSARSCSAGVSPSGDGGPEAGGDLVLEARHPHLEELVEVAG